MTATAITASMINAKMNEAVEAQESGDYATALSKVRSVKMWLSAKPDSKFDDEELIWNREAIDTVYAELKRLADVQTGSTKGSIVQIPVRRASSLLDES